MSRSVMISFFVICFVFSVQIVNQVNADYFAETDRLLFPVSVNDEQFGGLNTKLNQYTDDNMNASFSHYVSPTENPATSSVTEYFDTFTKGLELLNVLLYTIFYATIGFGSFLNNIGDGIVIIPAYITVPLTIVVNLVHMMNIMYFIRGVQFED